MRIVFFLVLLVGIVIAGSAVHMARGYIAQNEAELRAARQAASRVVDTTQVFTAARALRYGERLAREDVRAVDWPAHAVPEGVFVALEDIFPEGRPPRAVMRAMEAGEPLMQVKLTEPGQEAGIAARLAEGMRAFTIDVNVSTGVAGFLRPTDRVDIYWTGQIGGRGNETTRLMESAVRVIAVDQSADQDRTTAAQIARSVTVEVTQEQVAALALAQSTGRLSLALVGVTDETLSRTVEMSRRQLFGIEDAPAPAAAPEPDPVCTVRTRRGGEVVSIEIPCTN